VKEKASEMLAAAGGMNDNEEAIAELLYFAWAGTEKEPEWKDLPRPQQFRWLRTARLTMNREVDLVTRLANSTFRKRFDARLLARLDRWEKAEKAGR
jgi:hypothetical protein